MVHRVVFRVGSEEALDFWEERLRSAGVDVTRTPGSLVFSDPEGLGLELAVVETGDEPLTAEHPEIPAEHRIQGFDSRPRLHERPRGEQAVPRGRARVREDAATRDFEARGDQRGGLYVYDRGDEAGIPGAGTVHHVAWASTQEEHEAWRQRVIDAGRRPTPVIDRFYFKSIYFREPSGVLFEIATMGPGFTTDEPLENLGERLSLPPDFEHLREQVEPVLTPIPNPRESWAAR